jgi:G:T-mismatch repair DNA endonuclease (very short patch repair protein)
MKQKFYLWLIKYLKNLGYKVLVIKEHELLNEDEVKKAIIDCNNKLLKLIQIRLKAAERSNILK